MSKKVFSFCYCFFSLVVMTNSPRMVVVSPLPPGNLELSSIIIGPGMKIPSETSKVMSIRCRIHCYNINRGVPRGSSGTVHNLKKKVDSRFRC